MSVVGILTRGGGNYSQFYEIGEARPLCCHTVDKLVSQRTRFAFANLPTTPCVKGSPARERKDVGAAEQFGRPTRQHRIGAPFSSWHAPWPSNRFVTMIPAVLVGRYLRVRRIDGGFKYDRILL